MSPTDAQGSGQGLPILISVPAAPSWLVARYVIQCGYLLNNEPNQKVSGGSGEFDYRGGTFTGVIQPNPSGGFASTVNVDITVEYTPESGLPTLFQSQTVPVGPSGAKLTLELPNRRLAEISLYIDLPHGVVAGDFLMLNWSYIVAGKTITTGHKQIKDKMLLESGVGTLTGPFLIRFIADPHPTGTESFHLEIDGKYYSKAVPKYKADFSLSQSDITLFLKGDAQGGGSHFEGS